MQWSWNWIESTDSFTESVNLGAVQFLAHINSTQPFHFHYSQYLTPPRMQVAPRGFRMWRPQRRGRGRGWRNAANLRTNSMYRFCGQRKERRGSKNPIILWTSYMENPYLSLTLSRLPHNLTLISAASASNEYFRDWAEGVFSALPLSELCKREDWELMQELGDTQDERIGQKT